MGDHLLTARMQGRDPNSWTWHHAYSIWLATETLRRWPLTSTRAYLNLTNTNGDTLVMLASYYGHESAVAALIARGADIDRHNNRGQTPLAGAVFKNETTIMELLLGAAADPLAGSPSALETARFFGKGEIARQLQQHAERRGAALTSSRNARHRADHFAQCGVREQAPAVPAGDRGLSCGPGDGCQYVSNWPIYLAALTFPVGPSGPMVSECSSLSTGLEAIRTGGVRDLAG